MSLTDAKIRNAKPDTKPRKISDGGGLSLLITPKGSKLWRLSYRFGGKQKTLAIGAYPTVTLEEARDARASAKRQLHEGIDPSQAKQEKKRRQQVSEANTFGLVADEWVQKLQREGRADATLQKTIWLLDIAKPNIGRRPISEISAAEVLDVLKSVEKRGKLETARRLRSTIGAVMRYAIATSRAENDPSVALRGAISSPKVKHRAAILDPKGFGALLRSIDSFDGQPATRAALQLMALLFPRPGELRAAEWKEFDLGNAVWTVPAVRTKMRRDHLIPLSDQALKVIGTLPSQNDGGNLLFPSLRSARRPMSENTLNAALRRMGYSKDEATAHGFRASASTLLNEAGQWSPDVIERQLAHVERNAVRRAYSRGEHWEERVRMMKWWSDYLDSLKAVGQVILLPVQAGNE